jgi:hypothetical protein
VAVAPEELFPLDHFGRRFVVDLQAQFFKSDGQIPTVYPPQFFGLEFTGKIARLETLAIPVPIGVNRLNRAAYLQRIANARTGAVLQIPLRSGNIG